MQLFYTTSAGFNEPQMQVINSTGGYKSSTPVKNDDFDNIFGEISCYSVRQNRDEYLAIMLVNTTGAEATNVQLWIEGPTDPNVAYATLQVAVVEPTADSEGNPVIERTQDVYTRPFIGEFVSATMESPILIGTLDNNANLGIWLRRTLLTDTIRENRSNIYERDPDNDNLYRSIPLEQIDVFNLKIQYNE